ncbi:MAG: DUF4332 domain-containing protein [Hyphomicrobium sp.]
MSLLFRIIYAAHANGTHHKLALDALQHMERPGAERWRRMFLKHVDLYLEGSKAPDKSFKDFKNHVLHVGESYWGGAPEKVEAWYGHTVAALRETRWADAAYAAGVLSHYYTDPIHPFHTGQTEAENSIHRAVEWTINRSYNGLRTIGEARFGTLDVAVPQGAHWLKEMTCDGAEYSHRYYEKLIAQYDFKRGVVHPEEGFDDVGRTVIAELLMYAADGFGHILDRAVAESGVEAPDVNLSLATLIATLKIPAKWIEKKLDNAEDRRVVQAMYDELQATGRVEHSLPEDDRIVRDLHKREVLNAARTRQNDKRAVRVPEGDPINVQRAQIARASDAIAPSAPASDGKVVAAPAAKSKPRRRIEIEAELVPGAIPDPAPQPAANEADEPPLALPPRGTFAQVKSTAHRSSDPEKRHVYLTAVDDLEKAPSIGPKMAEQFAAIGVKTVADFLAHKPNDLSQQLGDRRMTAALLEEWQHQAQLVMEVPGLRGTHAQLLTGAGYRTAKDVAAADPVDFAADVLKFAASDAGKRVLREGNPPDIERIKSWVESARLEQAA